MVVQQDDETLLNRIGNGYHPKGDVSAKQVSYRQ